MYQIKSFYNRILQRSGSQNANNCLKHMGWRCDFTWDRGFRSGWPSSVWSQPPSSSPSPWPLLSARHFAGTRSCSIFCWIHFTFFTLICVTRNWWKRKMEKRVNQGFHKKIRNFGLNNFHLASSTMYSLSTRVSMGSAASHLCPNLMMLLYSLNTSLLVPAMICWLFKDKLHCFFAYFFTTQSASITALSIICSTRSGSWKVFCCPNKFEAILKSILMSKLFLSNPEKVFSFCPNILKLFTSSSQCCSYSFLTDLL